MIDIVANAEVQRQLVRNLEIILHITGPIIGDPAWLVQALREVCTIDQTEFKARESIASAGVELPYIALFRLIVAEVELSSERVE